MITIMSGTFVASLGLPNLVMVERMMMALTSIRFVLVVDFPQRSLSGQNSAA